MACETSKLIAARAGQMTLTAEGQMQLTAAAGDTAGGAIAFTLKAYSGGVMYPILSGIDWKGAVVLELAGITLEASVPVHRDHDTKRPVGHAHPTVADGGLVADGVFSFPGKDADEVVESHKEGFPWRVSVGTSNMVFERVAAGRSVNVNGRDFDGPILVVRQAHLDELSFVTVAGDLDTSAAIAAGRDSQTPIVEAPKVNFSKWLSDNGHDFATLSAEDLDRLHGEFMALENAKSETAEASAAAAGGDAGATATPTRATNATAARGTATATDATATLTAQRAAIADEQDRVDAITTIGASIANPEMPDGSRLVAHAIRNGLSVQQTTLLARRAARPSAPAIHVTGTAQRCTAGALQAAIILRAGRAIDRVMPASPYLPAWLSRPINDSGRDAIMNAAHEYRNGSLMSFVERSLLAAGRECPSGDNRHAVLRAAFSTNSIQAVFNDSIGSIALMAYEEAGDFSRGWTTETNTLNLLPHERPRMKAAGDLTLHPTGGTARHVSREATSETVKVDRFSEQATIDENDFINDNFGLLAETPRDFGRAAARLRPALVAAILLNNPTLARTGRAMFNTTDKSLITGSALTRATLQTARAQLAMQRDGQTSLNLPATHLIVPSPLGDAAIELTKSAALSNDSGQGSINPIYTRNLSPVEEARLANGMNDPLTGAAIAGSLTSWYVVSAEGHVIEVQFLQGTGGLPIVDVTTLAGSGEYGLNIRVKHFVGAAPLDCLSAIRVDA